MSIFCKHNWVKIKETYIPPKSLTNIRMSGFYDTKLLERCIHGATTILWECSKCNKIRKEEMLGKESE